MKHSMEASLGRCRALRRHRDDDEKIIDLCSPVPKRLKTGKNKEETELNDLPVDILKDILSRLPLAYLLQFARYTCPLWYYLLKTPAFADLHLSHSINNADLLYSLRRGNSTSTLYYMNNTPGHTSVGMKLIGDLGHKTKYTCFETCRGLLSYHSEEDKEAIFICNPITGDRVKIPLPNTQELARGFGYAPISKKYKYIRFAYDKAVDRNTCAVFTLGDNSWRELAHPHEYYNRWYSPVHCNGTLYWRTKNSSWKTSEVHILSIDLETEQYHVTRVFPSFGARTPSNSFIHLIVLRESVACAISFCHSRETLVWIQEVWVLMDEAQDIWIQKYRFQMPNPDFGSLMRFYLSGFWMNSELYGIQQRKITRHRDHAPSAYLEIVGMRCLSYSTEQSTYTTVQLPFANNLVMEGFSAQQIIPYVGSLVSPSKIVAG